MVNRQLAVMPPAAAPREEQLRKWLAAPPGWTGHYPETGPLSRHDIGVECDGRLLAAGQFLLYGGRCEVIWLSSEPDEPAALEDLIGGVENAAQGAGAVPVAGSRNELGAGWFGTPVVWDHVIRGLSEAGWVRGERWRIMTAEMAALAGPVPTPFRSLRLARREDPATGERSMRAFVGDVPAGDCDAWELPPLFRDWEGTAGWTTLEWLGVEEPFQRQGLGRHLLAAQAAWLAEAGFSRLLLFTETSNTPALRFFEACGFRPGPECWCLSRPYSGGPESVDKGGIGNENS